MLTMDSGSLGEMQLTIQSEEISDAIYYTSGSYQG